MLSGECFVASWYARISWISVAVSGTCGSPVADRRSALIRLAGHDDGGDGGTHQALEVRVRDASWSGWVPAWNTIRSFRPSDRST